MFRPQNTATRERVRRAGGDEKGKVPDDRQPTQTTHAPRRRRREDG